MLGVKLETIDVFIERYQRKSKLSAGNHKQILHEYFRIIGKEPSTYFDKPDVEQYKKDIINYWNTARYHKGDTTRKIAPLTLNYRLNVVKQFLMRNDVEIKQLFWKEMKERTKERGVLTDDRAPTVEELKRILQHAKIKERSWILLATSSGMRIGEIIKITNDDMKLEENPPRINIPAAITKSGKRRTTFCSSEARDVIKEWMKVKRDYIISVKDKNNFMRKPTKVHDPDTKVLFPFDYNGLRNQWELLLKRTELNEKDTRTNRYKIHIHALRKFAKTRMLLTMNEPMVNALIGHEGYLSSTYERYDVSQLAPEYLKAVNNLSIFEKETDLTDIKEQMFEKNQELHNMKKDYETRISRLEEQYRKEGDEKLLPALKIKKP